ncbi:MAG: aldo/keto reductase [Bacteroidales bacterium]|nr:aldo/keto reductase [Candidatus Latescibacterota bacterium]
MKKSGLKNRRDFLKTGLVGAAGMTVFACSSSKTDSEAETKSDTKKKLVHRKLGNTGIELPIVSLGTGDTSDPGLIKAALDGGVKLLATSQYYGNGSNEKMVGEVVKNSDKDSIIIVTSASPEDFNHREGVFNKGAKVEPFIEKIDKSLMQLGVECVDIFLLPFMAKKESVFYEPYLRAMEDIKKQGKARFIGIATHSHEDEAIRAAVEAKIYDVAMVAYNFRKKNRDEIGEAMAFASKQGMGIIAMKTMAGAFWDEGRTEPINSEAALKWVLQNENVHTTVPGVMTYDQLEKDLALMADLSLSDAEKADLKLSLHERPDGPFCQQCGSCVPQCTKSLDIPTLMRSHMYAYGYRNLAHAQETLSSVVSGTDPCGGCATCSVSCAMDFNVRSKIAKVARLNDVPGEFLV